MSFKFVLAAVFLAAGIVPALAQSSACSAPIAPETVDGGKATEAQMKAGIADFKTFQAASDDYQSCLQDDYNRQVRDAANAKDPKPLDPSVKQGVDAKITANQRLKERVGGELNGAIAVYKSKHPGN